MLFLRALLAFFATTCLHASPISPPNQFSSVPDISQLLNPYTLSILTDTVAFSSSNPEKYVMRVVYTDTLDVERHFDAAEVRVNGLKMRCSSGIYEIVIDRSRILHMHVVETF